MAFRHAAPEVLGHECDRPQQVSAALFSTGDLFWDCDECGAVYRVHLHDQGGAHWMVDGTYAETYEGEDGKPVTINPNGIYQVRPGSAQMRYAIGGIPGKNYTSTYHLTVEPVLTDEDRALLNTVRRGYPPLEDLKAKAAQAREGRGQAKDANPLTVPPKAKRRRPWLVNSA